MIQKVRFSQEFEKAFKQLKKRYVSLPNDFKALLESLVVNPYQGVALTDGMRKVRLSISSKRRGKRGGGRVIIRIAVDETQLSILYIYDKSDMNDVSDAFLRDVIIRLENE